MAGPASDVFISYKAEERKRLVPLVEALEAEGFSVWWDQNISGGANWREEIEAHLDAANVVIVVWSKRTIGPEGRFVRDEAGQAQEAGHYLPITIDNVRPPLGFREVQALDLSSWWGKRDDPRFKVLADTIRARLEGKEIKHHLVLPKGPAVSRRTAIAGGIGVSTIAVAGVGGWLLLKPGAAEAKRIAVLPFANMSSDQEQAYFADGVAEELRAALSRIGLEVIGRASSDAVKELDTKAAASKLGVAHILSGSVRRSPETIRVNAQLVGGEDGVERWAQSYDRAPGDAIKIQTEIAANVAQALSVALGQAGRAAIALGGTADSAAQDLYLRGVERHRSAISEEATLEALGLFNAAIARDRNYADAYVYKAVVLNTLGSQFIKSPEDTASKLAQAAAAGKQAVKLAPKLGYAHAVAGLVDLSQLNFAASLQNTRKALALSPDEGRVIRAAANIIPSFGDRHEAQSLADRLLAIDPLDSRTFGTRAFIFLRALRQYPEAIAAARRALEIAPERGFTRLYIADALTLMNQPPKALAEYRQLPAADPFRLAGEAIIAARARDIAGVERTVAHMRGLFGNAASYQYAEIYAQGGDAAKAFGELHNAVLAKDPGLADLKIDPFLDPIRSDPRFAALLERLNFPA